MAEAQARQERFAAIFMSCGALLVAGMEFLGRPAPGEFVEPDPDWYANFTIALHGAILLLLLFALIRLPKTTADRPGLRLPLTLLVLVGIAAAAYVVGVDLGMV
jgi:hypothetical protein